MPAWILQRTLAGRVTDLEDVHVQATLLIPAKQPVVVGYLGALRLVVVGDVAARAARTPAGHSGQQGHLRSVRVTAICIVRE